MELVGTPISIPPRSRGTPAPRDNHFLETQQVIQQATAAATTTIDTEIILSITILHSLD